LVPCVIRLWMKYRFVTSPEKKRVRKQESLRDFSQSLPMTLLRAREAVMGRFRPNLRAHQLTDQQWRVLRALLDHGKKNLGELAGVCCLLKPSITRIIRSLEQRDLLEKHGDTSDHRRMIVSISAKGRDLVAKAGRKSEEIYQDIEAEFGDYELADLFKKLDILIIKLDKVKYSKQKRPVQ
jgi:homoprotocatechuate degradation regulator HpaR